MWPFSKKSKEPAAVTPVLLKEPMLEKKNSAVGSLLWNLGRNPAWMKREAHSFISEGYMINAIVYQAVNRICDAIALVDWDVTSSTGEVLPDHPLNKLWHRPNPMQSRVDFLHSVLGYLMLTGNAFIERRVVNGKLVELYSHNPTRFRVIPGGTGFPQAYRYEYQGRRREFRADQVTGDSDIYHMRLFHPADDWYGMSPVEAAAYAIDQHNEASVWLKSLLENSARPSGALIVKDDRVLGDDQFARLKGEVDEKYVGSRNAGRPMLLEGGLDWKSMGLSPMDMNLVEAKFSSARDICIAFGVPPQLLAIPGDNTYSNYREARLAFYEDTVLPLLRLIKHGFNHWLEGPINGALLEPNLDNIAAIADKRMEQWKMADESTDLTVDERRAIKGYDPLPEGEGEQRESTYRSKGQQLASVVGEEEGENEAGTTATGT